MEKPKKVNVKPKIILTYAIGIAIACLLFYLVIPYLLNYGPGTINTAFDKEVSGGLYYYQQILLATVGIILVVSLVLFSLLKDIDSYPIYKQNKTKYKKRLDYIKKICLNLPNRLLLVFMVAPLFLCIGVLFVQSTYITSSDFKLMLVIFILSTITISITNMYVKRLLSKILVELENTTFSNVKRNGIVKRLLFQIIPIMSVCIVFSYLAISSIYERNNAKLLADYYNNQFKNDLETATVSNKQDLIELLNKVNLHNEKNVLFVADENFNFIYKTGELSDFFKKYAKELSLQNNYVVYDFYGTSGQGTLYPVTLENGDIYYLGASYVIYDYETAAYIVSLLVVLGLVCSTILYGFASELAKNVKEVSDSLEQIVNNNETLSEKKLYITSVDEIGELIKVYNDIQAITIDHLNQIHNNQETLMERERLASLGQLIGGIAHNLKTPIMSISGAAEGLNDLIKEYDSSIDDPEVNSEDHHEIAKDMEGWVTKVKTHTEYMSDVITAVKGQAVALNTDEDISFTVGELLKRVNILMKHELKHAIVYLNIALKTDENTVIHGDINSLVQVINNMISNAIQSYNGKPEQTIDLIVEQNDNQLVISIRDYGVGIPKKVRDKLFKEMITTKGKNGTGLGLYMSYSTIRAHFNGSMNVESEEGKGSTFSIILPV